MSLKQEALSGMVWTFSQLFGTQIISFAVSIVLARLLLPSDFGMIALLGVLMSVSMGLVESGLTSSLIRTKETDDTDYSTVFIFNLVVSIIIYVVLFFVAPFFAAFYELPNLTTIVQVYSVIIIINALTTVQQSLLTKKMDFKSQMIIRIPSVIVGGSSGLAFAYFGFGVWSLVYMAIIQAVMQCIQFWVYSKWRPHWTFDKEKFKFHFYFGYKMMFSGLLNIVFNNIYTIVIGKLFNPTQLGFYNRADSLKQLPVDNISNALNKVTYPLFSKIQDDDEKLRAVYKIILKTVIFIIAPIMICIIVIAEPLIRFLLTEKWLAAVPYLQILSIAGLLYPIHSYNLNILQVKGRSDLFLKLEVIKKTIIIIVIVISLKFGIYGLLWGQVFTSILALFVNTYYTGKYLDYGFLKQIKDLVPSIALSAVLGIAYWRVDVTMMSHFTDWARLLIIGFLYVITYLGFSKLLRFTEFEFIKNILLRK